MTPQVSHSPGSYFQIAHLMATSIFFLLDCNECSNYAEGDEGDFPIIEEVIGSHTLHFPVSSPSFALQAFPRTYGHQLAFGAEAKPPLVVMHPLRVRCLQN
ncbi:hypothetical protein XENOCAPTIV_003595 [Xenoophorus captivus]|uniref:Uncharacterized protein n=1 Tax=Xenoophorus captivus TaxID=1517983 RepID=A0ABV0RWM8_9TELE